MQYGNTLGMGGPPYYNPPYKATYDYAYETALKAEASSRVAAINAAKAQETANNARGLHKDLDDRTRSIEKNVRDGNITISLMFDALQEHAKRLDGLAQRVKTLEPKPPEPTAAKQLDMLIEALDFYGSRRGPQILPDTASNYADILHKVRKAL